MTKYHQDILKQPAQLRNSLAYSLGQGLQSIIEAAAIVRSSKCVYIAGIGASWCAGLAIQNAFNEVGFPVILTDASELLHHAIVPPDSVVILLSRSGRSIEIVQLVNKFRAAKGKIIGITNDPASVLAVDADATVLTMVDFDHSISVNTYTSIILVGILLASIVTNSFRYIEMNKLVDKGLGDAESHLFNWHNQLSSSNWLTESGYYYFLARGSSLSSAYESMLLWHEVVKQPASVLSTGFFRHGPQEILNSRLNMAVWLQNDQTRHNDIQLVNDFYAKGINLLIVGANIPDNLPGLHIDLPEVLYPFNGIVDIFPLQLAASLLAEKNGLDPDNFLYCNFIVEKEGGL